MKNQFALHLIAAIAAAFIALPAIAFDGALCTIPDATNGCDGVDEDLGDIAAGSMINLRFDYDEDPLPSTFCGFIFQYRTDPLVFDVSPATTMRLPSPDANTHANVCTTWIDTINSVPGFPQNTQKTECVLFDAITALPQMRILEEAEASIWLHTKPDAPLGTSTIIGDQFSKLSNTGGCAPDAGDTVDLVGAEIEVQIVPEPGVTMSLLAGGGFLAFASRRRSGSRS